MLTNTFCHIPGIGEQTERHLWSAGVTSWDCALPKAAVRLPRPARKSWPSHMQECIDNHANGNLSFFAERLPAKQHWRLYRDFKDVCAFLDIETTGLWGGEITTITLYDGRNIRYYVNGDNMDSFPLDVLDYRLLVTYNGKSFDVPFIERFFGIRLPHAHIDLKGPLRGLGLKGGLKGCERQLGIGRPGLEDVNGFIAVLLWNEYRMRKNIEALETLLAYNIQDTLVLHTLLVHAYNQKIRATPFSASHLLPMPSLRRCRSSRTMMWWNAYSARRAVHGFCFPCLNRLHGNKSSCVILRNFPRLSIKSPPQLRRSRCSG
jgi:uncharacterized protein YprB with RNaseH-like and TPR domain